MEIDSKIYIAGHKGMVGSAIKRKLIELGYSNLVLRASKELDLTNQAAVEDFFSTEKPEYVFIAAAKVGGILANSTYPADFIYQNLAIEINTINASYINKVKKLLFLGSTCIYPKLAPQPLKEEYMLTGLLEETNEAYAIAKIAGIKMCEAYRTQYGSDFISAMPTNLYGPNDSYDLHNSHVIPAMIRKFHESKINNKPFVELWGSGAPLREFMHVDDLAEACIFLMENYSGKSFVNIGIGKDISIKDLALMIKEISGYQGEIIWDTSKPDGTPKKLVDTTFLEKLGYRPRISLRDGLETVFKDYEDKEYLNKK